MEDDTTHGEDVSPNTFRKVLLTEITINTKHDKATIDDYLGLPDDAIEEAILAYLARCGLEAKVTATSLDQPYMTAGELSNLTNLVKALSGRDDVVKSSNVN